MAAGTDKVTAIVPAAGCGKRMGRRIPKQFLTLRGKPIFVHTLEKLENSRLISTIILVVLADEVENARLTIAEWGIRKVTRVVSGGKERQDSVWNGLESIPADAKIVVVHDAVRPFVSVGKIDKVVRAAQKEGAAVLAVRAKDTVKRGQDGWVEETLNRDEVWLVQTPQAFRADWIKEAYAEARRDGTVSTDDAALVERMGYRIRIVEGEERNIKITSPEDFRLACVFAEEEGE